MHVLASSHDRCLGPATLLMKMIIVLNACIIDCSTPQQLSRLTTSSWEAQDCASDSSVFRNSGNGSAVCGTHICPGTSKFGTQTLCFLNLDHTRSTSDVGEGISIQCHSNCLMAAPLLAILSGGRNTGMVVGPFYSVPASDLIIYPIYIYSCLQ